jgi:hypothetical protein
MQAALKVGWRTPSKVVQVLKGGGSLDTGEKKAQVEALSTGGVGMVHPSNGKSVLLPGCPHVNILPLIPHHLIGKVLVEKVVMSSTLSIGLEPPSQCGIYVCMTIKHILDPACHGSAGTPLGTHAGREALGLQDARTAIRT